MGGCGRGARMKIESDQIEWLAGVRAGETLARPSRCWYGTATWSTGKHVMAAEADAPGAERRRQVTRPRPTRRSGRRTGHDDRRDARDILERASARETVSRGVARVQLLLEQFGIEIGSHVVELGGVKAQVPLPLPTPLNEAADASPVRCLDREAEREIIARIDAAKAAGDTLGGVVEVVGLNLPVGLGSHISWDRKLDGRLAQALMSIPAVKGVELGLGFEAARRKGSEVHDEILPGLSRATNRAGGTEGGMTTGEPLVARVAMKPISTLMSPLRTVDLKTAVRPRCVGAVRRDRRGCDGRHRGDDGGADAARRRCSRSSAGRVERDERNFDGYQAHLSSPARRKGAAS
jgi:chorismate synthase